MDDNDDVLCCNVFCHVRIFATVDTFAVELKGLVISVSLHVCNNTVSLQYTVAPLQIVRQYLNIFFTYFTLISLFLVHFVVFFFLTIFAHST